MRPLLRTACPLLPIIAATSLFAADVDYLRQIKPLLAEKCYSCHGALKQESGLRLETGPLMKEGGDSGPVIVAGKPEDSLLLERITAQDPDERMPPPHDGSALKPDEIALIRSWIRGGAIAPDEAPPAAPSQHWAFQPIVRPTIPDALASSHPVDALLQVRRSAQGLVAQGPADRSILIRRLYLDLIGLPPTDEQLQDQRPWGEIVDELLASPHHGERWARHWMDIWRYSDWYGLGAQLRYSQKHIWRWRDWIVDSLNQDKGYDRMIQEMLAGDELAPDDPSVVAGTGYLARNYYLFNRTTWLDSTIEHTGKAFLGLTLNCAKCHDHKYDPITNVDYYRFRAIFEPHQIRLDPVPGVTDFEVDGLPRAFDDHVDAVTYLHVRGDPKNPDQEHPITPAVPAVLAAFQPDIVPIDLPPWAYAPGSRDYVRRDRQQQAEREIKLAEQELTAANKKLAEIPAESDSEPAAPDEVESFEFSDNFDDPNDKAWNLIGNGWEYREGALHQTEATRERHMARLLRDLPRDFELECRYTHTGGTTYKSVTFRFDQSDDGKNSNYVYTSAHAPGPKVHVAFERNGQSTYPPQGRRGRKIEIGKPYQLRVAVRDTLVNVWIDGEFMVAYRLPDRRDGFFSLSGFDATVAFDSITIRSLAVETDLTEAKNAGIVTMSDAEKAVAKAEARKNAAELALQSLQATIAADQAKYDHQASDPNDGLVLTAARLQAESMKASAQYRLLADATDAKKVNAANAQLKSADQKLAAIEKGDIQYETIRGARKALETPAHKEADYPATYSPVSTGRRLSLARWITSRQNPLTARVAVNHVWSRHFGTPLVESVFDFGLRSPEPQHVQLLDFLAAELIDSGWSLQHLHRVMVTSDAYQMHSSSRDNDSAAVDPTNRFYWRMHSRRMESQVVRDSLLKLAGKLDPKIGGPSIDPDPKSTRRSLYFKHSRDQQDKFLGMFDDADILQCYRRSESIVPQQALALSNSSLSIEMSAEIRDQIWSSLEAPDQRRFVEAAFFVLLGRKASSEETKQCEEFLSEVSSLDDEWPAKDRLRRAGGRLVQALLNHNDFITIR